MAPPIMNGISSLGLRSIVKFISVYLYSRLCGRNRSISSYGLISQFSGKKRRDQKRSDNVSDAIHELCELQKRRISLLPQLNDPNTAGIIPRATTDLSNPRAKIQNY